jgi:iron complex transport system ATP-binding protein
MPDLNPPLLQLKNLTVGYGRPVLSDVSLKLGRGLFVSLLGANGSGKTTLLRTIAGRLKPLGGAAYVNGRDLKSIRPANLAKIMSVVLTDKTSAPMLRVLEFAALGRYPHLNFMGRLTSRDLAVVENCLVAAKAESLAFRFVDELSDGERQKVVLARALAQEPALTLLDEPTAHLDLKNRLELMGILRGLCLNQGLTVLAAVHDVESAAKFSDLAATLKDGKLESFGRPEETLKPEAVRGLYECAEASYDNLLGGLEMAPIGLAGRAFVLGGQNSAALTYRLLAKKDYAISTGYFLASDLDAHVARALGAKIFVYENGQKPDPAAFLAFAKKELAQCDLLALAEPKGVFPEVAEKIESAALELGLPILRKGLNDDLEPMFLALDQIKAKPKTAA